MGGHLWGNWAVIFLMYLRVLEDTKNKIDTEMPTTEIFVYVVHAALSVIVLFPGFWGADVNQIEAEKIMIETLCLMLCIQFCGDCSLCQVVGNRMPTSSRRDAHS